MIDLDLYEAKKLYPFQEDTVSNDIDPSIEGTVGRSRFLNSSIYLYSTSVEEMREI